jgi:DNA-directed RNA polymerase subunit RPC12/RpoP
MVQKVDYIVMQRCNMEEFICCLCGKTVREWPNDPWPVSMNVDAKCCDDCNMRIVVPVRMARMQMRLNDREVQ